jgi:hypothetical protein
LGVHYLLINSLVGEFLRIQKYLYHLSIF